MHGLVDSYTVHHTPERIACETIYPMVAAGLETAAIYDAFAGEGDLVWGLLRWLPEDRRAAWFVQHVWLYDVRPDAVARMRERAVALGVPAAMARARIQVRDTLLEPPHHGANGIHITNPPWFYKGSVSRRPDAKDYWARYFVQTPRACDVYQIAMLNDLRLGVREAVYVVPPNFIFGDAVAVAVRREMFRYYTVSSIVYYGYPVFETTDQHALVVHMRRKPQPDDEPQFVAVEHREPQRTIRYREWFSASNGYRAGGAFDAYLSDESLLSAHDVRWYLTWDEILRRRGARTVRVLDVSVRLSWGYGLATADIDDGLFAEIMANPYFLRTLDSTNGERAGLYRARGYYGAEAVVAGRPHRTHPIQVRVFPVLPESCWDTVAEKFNATLEALRAETHDGFMTCFRYGRSPRRYLALSQAERLLRRVIHDWATPACSASAQ